MVLNQQTRTFKFPCMPTFSIGKNQRQNYERGQVVLDYIKTKSYKH